MRTAMQATRISFPCHWYAGDGTSHSGLADFKLGTGPCGKEVEYLSLDTSGEYTRIRQRCTDRSEKLFLYLTRDILGRIQIEFEPLPATPDNGDPI